MNQSELIFLSKHLFFKISAVLHSSVFIYISFALVFISSVYQNFCLRFPPTIEAIIFCLPKNQVRPPSLPIKHWFHRKASKVGYSCPHGLSALKHKVENFLIFEEISTTYLKTIHITSIICFPKHLLHHRLYYTYNLWLHCISY